MASLDNCHKHHALRVAFLFEQTIREVTDWWTAQEPFPLQSHILLVKKASADLWRHVVIVNFCKRFVCHNKSVSVTFQGACCLRLVHVRTVDTRQGFIWTKSLEGKHGRVSRTWGHPREWVQEGNMPSFVQSTGS